MNAELGTGLVIVPARRAIHRRFPLTRFRGALPSWLLGCGARLPQYALLWRLRGPHVTAQCGRDARSMPTGIRIAHARLELFPASGRGTREQ